MIFTRNINAFQKKIRKKKKIRHLGCRSTEDNPKIVF